MRVVIVSGTPKREGLCHSCVQSAREGVLRSGAECEILEACEAKLKACAVCGEGWGSCRDEHRCQFGDDGFTDMQARISAADALILVSPVYWGEMSEAMKTLFDRYRRCEALKPGGGALHGKKVLLVASPGESGNGMLSCLEQMERLCRHLKAEVFDYVGVNRWNREYKLVTVGAAAAALAASALAERA